MKEIKFYNKTLTRDDIRDLLIILSGKGEIFIDKKEENEYHLKELLSFLQLKISDANAKKLVLNAISLIIIYDSKDSLDVKIEKLNNLIKTSIKSKVIISKKNFEQFETLVRMFQNTSHINFTNLMENIQKTIEIFENDCKKELIDYYDFKKMKNTNYLDLLFEDIIFILVITVILIYISEVKTLIFENESRRRKEKLQSKANNIAKLYESLNSDFNTLNILTNDVDENEIKIIELLLIKLIALNKSKYNILPDIVSKNNSLNNITIVKIITIFVSIVDAINSKNYDLAEKIFNEIDDLDVKLKLKNLYKSLTNHSQLPYINSMIESLNEEYSSRRNNRTNVQYIILVSYYKINKHISDTLQIFYDKNGGFTSEEISKFIIKTIIEKNQMKGVFDIKGKKTTLIETPFSDELFTICTLDNLEITKNFSIGLKNKSAAWMLSLGVNKFKEDFTDNQYQKKHKIFLDLIFRFKGIILLSY